MHHPTDRITHTTAFVTPVVDHWLQFIQHFVQRINYVKLFVNTDARCSSVVRAFARGAMGRRIDPSWWIHRAASTSSQYNKGRGMYYHVCGMVHIKDPLLLIDKSSLCPTSYFQRHITVNKMELFLGPATAPRLV